MLVLFDVLVVIKSKILGLGFLEEKPIRKGVIGHTLMVEELGRRRVNNGFSFTTELWALVQWAQNFDHSFVCKIACASAGDARKWMEAFDQAKQQCLMYALLSEVPCKSLMIVLHLEGIRIFEDVANSKVSIPSNFHAFSDKAVLVKSVGVIDASVDSVFEVVLSLDRHQRYEWDMLTGDLELADSVNGHYDVVYGTYDPKYLTRWHCKRDFVFSRQWFRGQDGAYSLREYFGANPTLTFDSSTTVIHPSISDASGASSDFEDAEGNEEFYDAIAAYSASDDEDSDNEVDITRMEGKMKLKNVSWAIASLALRRNSAPDTQSELDSHIAPITVDASHFHGSLHQGKVETDTNCWSSPGGQGFMIRGKTYLKDSCKVMGGDPLLKLVAVDWFKADNNIDRVALHPNCLVQSEAGKKLPFILVINLEVPAKPNYSMVLYYAADRPVKKKSLLGKFINGTDMFRNARFKLIPSIVEGYWMVKRAVGTKACLLGKAVTCNYLRQDNFLEEMDDSGSIALLSHIKLAVDETLIEIDVNIGSSSVAKSIIGLVLGSVTSIVVDLAILIEAREEAELPEYILGTVRLNRVRVDSAVHFESGKGALMAEALGIRAAVPSDSLSQSIFGGPPLI
ncbi:hypothetical protein HHK36_013858 [Tetracentron sinense]|uniref:START domain-containing protein n=1 Tax=Tetracentron sinense TaxID=13715 RepID=A0A834Z443_TETSI|nr:hypothetical protein HHK36_013858 [Tetracentron sinense]